MASNRGLTLIYFYVLRERERESRGGAEGEGERIPSGLHAASTEPDVGLDPTTLGHDLS